MMVLTRRYRKNGSIIGSLFHNGQLIAYTAENEAKAIPVGSYMVQNSKSPKFGRELPLLYNAKVHSSRGIRIHRGNSGAKDSQGCVLVGMELSKDGSKILQSTEAEQMVVMLCRRDDVLVITEAP